jgi:glutathione S-transferase
MVERPILYSFRRCPYAMRARMAVAISGVEVELREVVLRDKPAQMVEASPKATVPVLVQTDGAVIDESLEIMRWALAQNDPDSWLSGDDADLIATNDGPFKAALDRYKYPHRYAIDDVTPFRSTGSAMLEELNARLSDQDYLTSGVIGITDIAIFPFVRQFAATDLEWFLAQPLPALQRWLKDLTAAPLFETIMCRLPPWRHGDHATLFP